MASRDASSRAEEEALGLDHGTGKGRERKEKGKRDRGIEGESRTSRGSEFLVSGRWGEKLVREGAIDGDRVSDWALMVRQAPC